SSASVVGDGTPASRPRAVDLTPGPRPRITDRPDATVDRLTLPILGIVLLAAVAHAAWNFLAKGAQGGQGFVWLYTVAASVLYLPVLIAALAIDPGPLGWEAFVFMAGSGVLHTVYASLLQRGYRTGDLSLVYPLARGTGPLVSTIAAIAFFGERPGVVALLG